MVVRGRARLVSYFKYKLSPIAEVPKTRGQRFKGRARMFQIKDFLHFEVIRVWDIMVGDGGGYSHSMS